MYVLCAAEWSFRAISYCFVHRRTSRFGSRFGSKRDFKNMVELFDCKMQEKAPKSSDFGAFYGKLHQLRYRWFSQCFRTVALYLENKRLLLNLMLLYIFYIRSVLVRNDRLDMQGSFYSTECSFHNRLHRAPRHLLWMFLLLCKLQLIASDRSNEMVHCQKKQKTSSTPFHNSNPLILSAGSLQSP